jgi:hypothetical protein
MARPGVDIGHDRPYEWPLGVEILPGQMKISLAG